MAAFAQVLHYHHSLLADSVRTEAFRAAIEEAVQPGDVVVDLGTGSGILAMFAARAGARKVYAIERGPVAALARELFEANGLSDRIELIEKESFAVDLPEPADVLITETLWNFGLGEGMVEFVADARKRFLRDGARIVPETVELRLAPVDAERHYGRVSVWSDRYGPDLSHARQWASNNLYIAVFGTDHLLAEPATLDRIELATVTPGAEQSGSATFEPEKDWTLHGFAGWFRSRLSRSVEISNEPPNQVPSWSQVFFPLERPLEARAGDVLRVEIQSAANGSVWRWRTTLESQAGPVKLDQSSFFGFPLVPSQQARVASDSRPSLSRAGEAERYVLDAFDGSRTIEQIEQGVMERFPDVFRREVEVGPFVRELAEKYG